MAGNPLVIPELSHWPHVITDATETSDGAMSAADKTKLDNIVGAVKAVVANAAALTGALAATVGVNGMAIVQSTNQIFITYDAVNWTALS